MTRFEMRLADELRDALIDLAKRRGVNVSQMVRIAIVNEIKKDDKINAKAKI
jgi:post-segregation antitoxin (ccd killing protein)